MKMRKHRSLKPNILGKTYKFWKLDFKHSALKKKTIVVFLIDKLVNNANA